MRCLLRAMLMFLSLLAVAAPCVADSAYGGSRISSTLADYLGFRSDAPSRLAFDPIEHPTEAGRTSTARFLFTYDDWYREVRGDDRTSLSSPIMSMDFSRRLSRGGISISGFTSEDRATVATALVEKYRMRKNGAAVAARYSTGRNSIGISYQEAREEGEGRIFVAAYPRSASEPLMNLFFLDHLQPLFGNEILFTPTAVDRTGSLEWKLESDDGSIRIRPGLRSTEMDVRFDYASPRAGRRRGAQLNLESFEKNVEASFEFKSGIWRYGAGTKWSSVRFNSDFNPSDADPSTEVTRWGTTAARHTRIEPRAHIERVGLRTRVGMEATYIDAEFRGDASISTPIITYLFFVPVLHRAQGDARGRMIGKSLLAYGERRFAGELLTLRGAAGLFDADLQLHGSTTTNLAAGIVSGSYATDHHIDRLRIGTASLGAEVRLGSRMLLDLCLRQTFPWGTPRDEFHPRHAETAVASTTSTGAEEEKSLRGGTSMSAAVSARF